MPMSWEIITGDCVDAMVCLEPGSGRGLAAEGFAESTTPHVRVSGAR
jgi:hypothetical protein